MMLLCHVTWTFGCIWRCAGLVTTDPCGLSQVDRLDLALTLQPHAEQWSGTQPVTHPSAWLWLVWLLFACFLVGLQLFLPKYFRTATASDVCQFYAPHAAPNVPAGCTVERYLRSSRCGYGDGVFWRVANELRLLAASGESPRLTDSDHISAAVEGGTWLLLSFCLWNGRGWTHMQTHRHPHTPSFGRSMLTLIHFLVIRQA